MGCLGLAALKVQPDLFALLGTTVLTSRVPVVPPRTPIVANTASSLVDTDHVLLAAIPVSLFVIFR